MSNENDSVPRPRPRHDRGSPHERPRFGAANSYSSAPRPFPVAPTPQLPLRTSPPPPEPMHSLHANDGAVELEVSGSAEFVREAMDRLPALLATLHHEPPPRPESLPLRPAAIGLPPPPPLMHYPAPSAAASPLAPLPVSVAMSGEHADNEQVELPE